MWKEQVKIEDTEIDFDYCFTNVFIQNKNELKASLINITNEFIDKETMTLKEIYEYCKDKHPNTMIYVVEDMGTIGTIYRCGNYEEGIWQQYAKTMGYA